MKKYLVIGNPIEHSQSPLIHNYWMKKYRLIDSVYEKLKVAEDDIKDIIENIRNDKIYGVNVTVPFKKKVMHFCDKLDKEAMNTGSVNTLHKINNKIIGYNTDTKGFKETVADILYPSKDRSVKPSRNFFVLGAGGVTPSIIDCLRAELGSKGTIWVSNRTKKKADELKKLFSKTEVIDWGELPPIVCDMVINTTSVGLKKDESINIDFTKFNKKTIFYDLIYNPKETNFLKEARSKGNKIVNGQMMFLNQAKEAFRIWTNITPEIDDEVIKILNK